MLHIANLTLPRMMWEMSTTPPSLWSLDMFWLLWSRIGPYVTSHSILIGLHLLLSSLGSNIVLRIACCVVGIGLPVYTTFKAIEKKDLEDQEQCLVYWAVYGCFNIVEVFSDMLISWFPLYYHAKLAFLIWLQIPSTFGSRNIYMRYLRPFLQIHQTRLDRIVGRAYNEINNIVVTHQREIQFVRIPIQKMVMAVYHIIKDIIQSSQPWRDGTADDAADRTIESTTSDAD